MSFLLSLLLFHIQHSWNIVDNIVITLFAAIYFLNLFSYLFSSYYDYFEWNPLLLLDFLMILRWLLKHLHHFSYSLFVPVRSCLIAYDCCYFELHRRWYSALTPYRRQSIWWLFLLSTNHLRVLSCLPSALFAWYFLDLLGDQLCASSPPLFVSDNDSGFIVQITRYFCRSKWH